MYQLRQLIPISNINNWCWSMQLKINWQVTVAQWNSNCSRIGIFSVYITGVRLSDWWQGCNHLQLCSLVLFHYRGLCPHCSPTLYIYIAVECTVRAAAIMTIYMITEHCAVGVIIAGARTHATLLCEDDVWMTWVPDLYPIWEHSGVLKVLILLPHNILMVWGQLAFTDLESADLCLQKLNVWHVVCYLGKR